ncbi:MAG TPA: GntR family transcriptional regulator [Acidobacteriota bacterium]|nr:GntR family transcriptional regulator [Acidobacteriota bacterium]
MTAMIIDRSSPIPQYFQLQTWLIEQMEQGVFRPSDRIPTEEELVRITGLARATVRQAVQNLTNMGYLSRQRRRGTFVLNRMSDSGRRTIVGILVPDIRSGYAPELARGAEDEAARNRHSLILCSTDDLFVKADLQSDRLIEEGVNGVIFVPTAASDDKNLRIVEKFTRRNIPVVLADRTVPGVTVDFVTTDNFQGAYALTEYLVRRGHRRIVIALSTLFSTERERLEGYKKALTDMRLRSDPSLVFASSVPYHEKRYMEYARDILGHIDSITAIFAGHDRIAYLFYAVAQDMGISIPRDVSLVGYDDLPFTHSHPASLTTVHQPIYEMGLESMKRIMCRIRGEGGGPHKVVLKSHLVERSSVLPVRDTKGKVSRLSLQKEQS